MLAHELDGTPASEGGHCAETGWDSGSRRRMVGRRGENEKPNGQSLEGAGLFVICRILSAN